MRKFLFSLLAVLVCVTFASAESWKTPFSPRLVPNVIPQSTLPPIPGETFVSVRAEPVTEVYTPGKLSPLPHLNENFPESVIHRNQKTTPVFYPQYQPSFQPVQTFQPQPYYQPAPTFYPQQMYQPQYRPVQSFGGFYQPQFGGTVMPSYNGYGGFNSAPSICGPNGCR